MRAIVCQDFGESRLEEVSKPAPRSDELLLEIERVQLSVTECNLYYGNEIAHYDAIENRLTNGDGRMFGHEFSATVVGVGDDVTGHREGDRVYAPGKIPCHDCQQCRTGFELHCPNKTYIGYDIPGTLSEYAALPAEALCTVPDGVSEKEAAALQPLASALLCVEEADIQAGDVVAVFGTGVMGYQCAQLALTKGASNVVAIDVDPRKLDHAESRGLLPVNARKTDPVERVDELTGGTGADVAFEAVGGAQSDGTDGPTPLDQAFDSVRAGGTVVQVGYIIGDVSLTPRRLRSKSVDWINPVTGVTAKTPNATTGEYAAELVAQNRVSIEEYVTHELEGLESFERAVEITMNKEEHGALGPAQMIL